MVNTMAETNWIKKFNKQKNKTRSIAIKAFCFNCVGGTEESSPDPGWQEEIRNCSVCTCPLHIFRPYKERKKQNAN